MIPTEVGTARKRHFHTKSGLQQIRENLALFQRTAKGASGKEPRQKTSKIVSTLFDIFCLDGGNSALVIGF